jgi:hypothetical protein
MKTYGKWRCSSSILDIDTRWGWAVSVTTFLLYPRVNSPQYSLYRTLGGIRSLSGNYEEKSCQKSNPDSSVIRPVAYSLHRLSYCSSPLMNEGRKLETEAVNCLLRARAHQGHWQPHFRELLSAWVEHMSLNGAAHIEETATQLPQYTAPVPPHQLRNAWTSLNETWYTIICHGTWTHLNDVFHKSLPSVCVCLCISPERC